MHIKIFFTSILFVSFIILIPATNARLQLDTQWWQNTTSVYTENFTNYSHKEVSQGIDWDVWSNNLHLSPINGSGKSGASVTALSDNNFLVTWLSWGGAGIYAQKVDLRGNRLWSQDNRVNANDHGYHSDVNITNDAIGGAFVTWVAGNIIYLQRIDSVGNHIWGQDVLVSPLPYTAKSPSLIADGNGGVVIVWQDQRSGNWEIYAQRINSDGQKIWPADVQLSNTSTPTYSFDPSITKDSNANFVVVWQESTINRGSDIFAQKLSITGSQLWDSGVLVNSDNTTKNQMYPALTSDQNGGVIVVWTDYRRDDGQGDAESDIYAQRLNENGERLWANDQRSNSLSNDPWLNGSWLHYPNIVASGDGNFFVSWNFFGFYLQKIDIDGNRLWEENNKITGYLGSQDTLGLVHNMFHDQTSMVWATDNNDIHFQSFNSKGKEILPWSVRINMGSGAAIQRAPNVVADDNGGALLVWVDDRNTDVDSPTLQLQRFNNFGSVNWPHSVEITSGVGGSAFDPENDAAILNDEIAVVWGGVDMQRVDTSGNLQWENIQDRVGFGHSPEVVMLSDGTAIVAWQVRRSTPSTQSFDVYAQRIGLEGERLWGESHPLNSVYGSGLQYLHSIDAATNQDNLVTVVWSDYYQENEWNIMAQQIDPDGILRWTGGRIVNKDLQQSTVWNPSISMDSFGNSYVVWLESNQGSQNIYMQRLNSDGSSAWANDIFVGEGSCSPQISVDSQGGILVIWVVSQEGIYAQRYNSNGIPLWSDAKLISDADVNCSITLPSSLSIATNDSAQFFVAWSANDDVFSQKFNLSGDEQWSQIARAVPLNFFYTPTGTVRSQSIDNTSETIHRALLTMDYELNSGDVQIYLSNNGGTTWELTQLGKNHVFTSIGSDLRWRVDMKADPNWPRTPIVHSLSVEYSTDQFNGDDYELDDTCNQAQPIQLNGVAQQHTFHQPDDSDWAWFDGQAGTTYTVQTSNTGPNADTVLELYGQCGQPPNASDDNAFGPGATLTFPAPTTGRYYIRVLQKNGSVYGDGTDYDLSVRAQVPTGAAIIVAGRLEANDTVQPIIEATADLAYRSLLQGGLSPDNIQYLSTATNRSGVDGLPTEANVRDAIQNWARTRVGLGAPLWLYMADHGNVDRFHNEIGETITAAELNLWLSNLEATSGVDQINVIIDACFSGSFIDTQKTGALGLEEISGQGRVVVSSTTSRWWAYAPNIVSGQSVPLMYFSDGFWRAIGTGQSIWTAFMEGRASVEGGNQLCGDYAYTCQRPWLDDTGDAWFDETDGLVAQTRGLNASFGGGSAPYIDWLTVDDVSGNRATIRVQVRDDSSVERVWARIFAPSFTPPETTDGSIPEIEVPEVELVRQSGDVFAIEYAGFTETGAYQVVVYAQDDETNVASPRWVLTGEQSVYLPLVVK